MSFEKEHDYVTRAVSLPEREKTIEQQRQEEETRIKNIEQRIDDWAKQFFVIIKDYFLENEDVRYAKPSLEDLDQNKVDQLLQKFPRELVKTKQDLKYVLSRVLKSFGKANIDFEGQENGKSLCYQKNIDTIYFLVAKISGYSEKVIEDISYLRPVFFREDKDALQDIQIKEEVRKTLPPKFFQNPTKFIEALDLIERGDTEFGHNIDDLAAAPYDFTRVKIYKKLVFKRVDLSKVNFATEEINEAQKIAALLHELEDLKIQVQNFFGFVYDQGNIYLVSEFVPNSENLWDHCIRFGRNVYMNEFDRITAVLKDHHIDLERRNVLIQYTNSERNLGEEKTFVLIDFETKQ